MAGSGEPLLFLHGVPDSSDVWLQAISAFKSQYLCIAPDLPGFGETLAPKNFDYSLDNLALFMDSLLDALVIKQPIHLVIHDIGGIVGLAFAIKHPDKLKSLTIMDTVFFSDYKWHAMAKTWRKPIIGELVMYLMRYKQFSAAMTQWAPTLSHQQIAANYRHLSVRNRALILRFYRALDPVVFHDWQPQLPVLTQQVPTQVIWGAKDKFLPVSLAKRFCTDRVHIIEGCGHWPMLEHPPQVHSLIEHHIKSVSKLPSRAKKGAL